MSLIYTNTRVLYIDPSVVAFSHEYILYLMIAMVPCIFLVFIPALLLCVYPTRIYRRLSHLISTRKQLAITAFAEALHNCFKDGLNGTRDYRALAGLIILVYPVASLSLILTSINHNVTDTNTQVLYIDPSVVYYSHEHILYLVIAMVPCIFLVFIPALLLCVYPTRIYRRLSQLISTTKQLAITTFAEALHNCFKDGLNGTRDYRAFAGLIVLGFPVASLLSYITWKIVAPATGLYRDQISGYMLFAVSLIVSYVRPCKSTLANFSLSYHVFMLGVLLSERR